MLKNHDKISIKIIHKNRTSGFTIVELLIVIVVIDILAAIVIVAFNDIQTRAANTKTTSAAGAWTKAIQLYYTDKGQFPSTARGCLGMGYPVGFEGSGTTQCRTSGSDIEQPALNTELRPYLGGSTLPSPDMTAVGTASDWFRGILYYNSGPDRFLAVTLRNITSCPSLSGLEYFGYTDHQGGLSCRYKISV